MNSNSGYRDYILVVDRMEKRAIRVVVSEVVTSANVRKLAKKMAERYAELLSEYPLGNKYDVFTARCETIEELSRQLPTIREIETLTEETVSCQGTKD